MAVSEQDLELLETYLDGELPGAEVDALIDRLRMDPALASAMETAKAERQVRMGIWTSCEPSEASVQRLLSGVQRKVDNHWSWASRLSKLRMVTGAAACILIGVFMGYAGRNRNPAPNNQPVVVSTNTGISNTAGNSNSGPVEIPIVDEYGKVVAVQRFATQQDAQQFLDEMRQWQEGQEKAPAGNTTPVQHKF